MRGFGPKLAIFQLFVLGNIVRENVFYDILEQKKQEVEKVEKVTFSQRG